MNCGIHPRYMQEPRLLFLELASELKVQNIFFKNWAVNGSPTLNVSQMRSYRQKSLLSC